MAWAVRDVALLGDRDSYPNLTAAWAIKVNEGPLNYRPLKGIIVKRIYFFMAMIVCTIALTRSIFAVVEIPYSERVIVWALLLIACGLMINE